MAFPCYLLDMNELSETAKTIYCMHTALKLSASAGEIEQ